MYIYVPFVVVDISTMQVSMLRFSSYICSGNVSDVGNIYPRFGLFDEWNEWNG